MAKATKAKTQSTGKTRAARKKGSTKKGRAVRSQGSAKTSRGRKKSATKTRVHRVGYNERDYAGAAFNRITMIGAAGLGMIVFIVGGVLWSGGYIGGASDAVRERTAKIARDAGLVVERITLRGAHDIAHADLLDAVGPIVGESILHVDIDAARARVEELGGVRVAAVTRLLPDTINISIRERKPSAVWRHDGKYSLIDASGAVIKPVNVQAYSHLPLVVGAGAPDAASIVLNALQKRPEIAERASALYRIGERRWDLELRNGLIVRLPDSTRPEAQNEAINVVADLALRSGVLDDALEYIDLIDPDRMLLGCKAGFRSGEDGCAKVTAMTSQ